MAHTRAYRHQKYWEAVEATIGTAEPDQAAKGGTETGFVNMQEGLDQVVYDPRRLAFLPSRGGEDSLEAPAGDVDELVEEIMALIPVPPTGQIRVSKRKPAEWEELEAWVIQVPGGEQSDSYQLARQLDDDPRYRGQIGPVLYSVTQQITQPGEDPEPAVAPQVEPPVGDDALGLGHGMTIAVLDTGIDPRSAAAAGLSTLTSGRRADPEEIHDPTVRPHEEPPVLGTAAGHGTFIAGLVHSVAPGATVNSYRVASSMGVVDEELVCGAIMHAIADEANVIVMSFGGYPFVEGEANGFATLRAFACIESAIALIPPTSAVVAAAGNCGSGDPFYPAAFERVIGVAALDRSHRLWEHSNFGPWVAACALGVELRSLFVRGRENPVYEKDDDEPERWEAPSFATWTGTSFAAPLVAAQIAILAAELGTDAQSAANHLLRISRDPHTRRRCGKRILVDVPGQT